MVSVVRSMLVLIVLAGLITGISACGFQPRGSAALPAEMALTYISSDQPYASLVDDFSRALQVHGGRVTRERDAATAELHILSDSIESRLLSIDTNGKALEYEVRQSIRISVTTGSQTPLLQEQELSMARSYLYVNTDVLGKQREDRALRRSLQLDLVNLALLRITAAAR